MLHKPLPVGVENFEKMIDSGYYYVDKTLFIKELIDKKGEVNLFTRPRRFGKTLNLSMLQHFFDISKKGSSHIFDGLQIMSAGEKYTSEMNKYPVISLSLKAAELSEFRASLNSLKEDIINEFIRYEHLLESVAVPQTRRAAFKKLMNGEAEDDAYRSSLKLLSACLEAHYGKKAIILIDEYDVPLEKAHFHGYYPQMLDFIRSFLHSGLKTNDSLHFAVMTGCLRVSKESIFTGLNNPNILTILSDEYGEYFGFTEDEVAAAFSYYGFEGKLAEAHGWYNGYIFGNVNVYNPWSLIRYMRDIYSNIDRYPSPYWSNTSSNLIIRELIDEADSGVKSEIEALIGGESITKPVTEDTTYGEIFNNPNNIWSFLLFTGYLKITGKSFKDKRIYAKLEIPNTEVWTIYRDKIMEWFGDKVKAADSTAMYAAIMSSDLETFEEELSELLAGAISYHDSHENFYHGFMTGALSLMKDCIVKSNRESGDGRGDIFIMPGRLKKPAVVLELKASNSAADMEEDCAAALRQIDEKGYVDELNQMGFKTVLKYGISFYRKNCVIASG